MADKLTIQQCVEWLTDAAKRELAGCQITSHDGTTLYTPDGQGNYQALWTRDFAYMVENAFDLLPTGDVRDCINILMDGQRADGCIPDRVQSDGRAVYSAGPVGNPLGDPPTDNVQFMVNLVYTYVMHTGDAQLAGAMLHKLHKAMDYVPRSERGLVNIPSNCRRSPYGFTDTIAKTGELLFSSILYWKACIEMAELCNLCSFDPAEYLSRAQQIVSNMDGLWDDEQGAYLAATIQCTQVDVWGNAYAVYSGFLDDQHTPHGRKAAVVDFLIKHYAEYISRGQVRHLLNGNYWEKTLMPVAPGTYQNGAYWATASGWVLTALYEEDESLAIDLLFDLVNDFKEVGIYECVNGAYTKLNHYVVSAVNPLGASKLLSA